MSQYKIKDRDDLTQCPFDNTHMIRTSRMQYHLRLCKKNHHGLAYEICPFNARHYINKPELQHHIQNCPDRAIIENDFLYAQRQKDGSYFQGDCSVPEYNNDSARHNDGEDWDAECDGSRGTFKWGETNVNDYFNRRGRNQPDHYEDNNQPVRLPRDMPQVLRTPNGMPTPVVPSTKPSSYGGTQRLPRTLPNTAMLGGLGRGRGVASLQNQAHTGAASWGQPPQLHNGHAEMNGAVGGLSNSENHVPKPRGRGYGKIPNGDASSRFGPTLVNGYVDEDVSSNSSMESDRSASSRSRGGARRKVNADRVGISNPMNTRPRAVNTPTWQPNGQAAHAASSNGSTPEQRASPTLSYAQQAAAPSPTLPRANALQQSTAPLGQTTRPLLQPTPTPMSQNPTIPLQPAGVRPHSGLLGIGRGAGRGFANNPQTQFIVPNVNKTMETDAQDNVEQIRKQIRKCEKKIREIEMLEANSKYEDMNEAERTKVQSKKNLLMQLRELDQQT